MSTCIQGAGASVAHYLEPLLTAAILTGRDAGAAAEWITRDATAEAEDILRAHGLGDAADRLAELRLEPPLAAASIKFTMTADLAAQMSGGTRDGH